MLKSCRCYRQGLGKVKLLTNSSSSSSSHHHYYVTMLIKYWIALTNLQISEAGVSTH